MTGASVSPTALVGPDEGPEPRSRLHASHDIASAARFEKAPVELTITNPRLHISVPGHSDGTFGIDRRHYYDDEGRDRVAHTITHLRTGGVVRHVKGPLSNAKRIAAILHKASWEFDAPEECKNDGREEAVREANDTGLCIASWRVSLPDETLEAIAKARGEQVQP